ncbi:MAG: hypothetical protein RDV48_24105 [Candidatus Eremiobacteraeota bacterium]|nr:hypothetical protein [Candidatus Eremiobacteraeota bacterium]
MAARGPARLFVRFFRQAALNGSPAQRNGLLRQGGEARKGKGERNYLYDDGSDHNCGRIARLNADGTFDTDFNPGRSAYSEDEHTQGACPPLEGSGTGRSFKGSIIIPAHQRPLADYYFLDVVLGATGDIRIGADGLWFCAYSIRAFSLISRPFLRTDTPLPGVFLCPPFTSIVTMDRH